MNELNPRVFYLITKRGPLDTVMTTVIGAIEDYAKTKKIEVVLPEKGGYIGADDSAIIITIGGDGTALEGFKLGAQIGIPIITVNLGTLGFLADIAPEVVVGRIDDILNGEHILEERMALSDGYENLAANEFYISHAEVGRLFRYSVYVDGILASEQGSDGVIIATPTGSTAYSLAAGGAILSPAMKAIQVVPVAPHTLTGRPLIVSYKSKVEIEPHSSYYVKADGRIIHDYPIPEKVRIMTNTRNPIKILHPKGWNFYSVLEDKLSWEL